VTTDACTKQNPTCLMWVRAKKTGVEIIRAFLRYRKKIIIPKKRFFRIMSNTWATSLARAIIVSTISNEQERGEADKRRESPYAASRVASSVARRRTV
jgi:hypothetical protein